MKIKVKECTAIVAQGPVGACAVPGVLYRQTTGFARYNSRLPLISGRPKVTFPASDVTTLDGTNLYCLLNRNTCDLPRVAMSHWNCQKSNWWPLCCFYCSTYCTIMSMLVTTVVKMYFSCNVFMMPGVHGLERSCQELILCSVPLSK